MQELLCSHMLILLLDGHLAMLSGLALSILDL